MFWRVGLLLIVVLSADVSVAQSKKVALKGAHKASVVKAVDDPDWLRERLDKIRTLYDLPDLGAVVVKHGRVVASSAVGVRKYGTNIKVTPNDPFHLGSITKVMTASLVGMMIDDGVLSWDTTMEEMFPELVSSMQSGYRKVTVLQLLSHTGGFPYGPSKPIDQITAEGRDAVERRYGYVKASIVDPLGYEPGKGEMYSGGGIVVMSFIERKVGKSYEQLMHERLFNPLGMTTAGIADHMASEGKVDAPWGHRQENGKTIPREPDHHSPVNGRQPVGGVFVSMPDMGKYLAFQLSGARGRGELLKPETFKRLQTSAPGTGFGPGWIVGRTGEVEGPALIHNGSIGIHVATCWVVPNEDFAIAAGTNAAGEPRADEALDTVMKFLILQTHRRLAEGAVDRKSSGKRPVKANPVPPRADVWLDSLKPVEATVGYGKFEVGTRDGGSPLMINGDRFEHGLGVHASSTVSYTLKPEYKKFVGRVGPDDRASWRSSIVAQVWLDGLLIQSSPLLRAGDPPWNFEIAIPAALPGGTSPRTLRLVVTDGGDGINSDSADWVDAGFVVKRK
ncbi:MAG: hypothetical protein C0478_11310 [Planctomyces sp.]|nr:hypothetical protein [Planctomyces sp.]